MAVAGPSSIALIQALDIGPDSTSAERTIDITTTARWSWFHHLDDRWYLTGMPVRRNSYANLRAAPRFTVHLMHGGTADLPPTADPVDDTARSRVITRFLDLQNRPVIGGRVGRHQTFDDWFARAPLVEIVFDDEQSRKPSSARPE